MKYWRVILTACLLIIAVLSLHAEVLAFTGDTGLGKTGGIAYKGSNKDLPVIVGNIIQGFVALLGLVLMVIVIYGGIRYMVAGGNEEDVRKARAWIVNGIIGLVVISLAYAISSYVVQQIGSAVGGGEAPPATPEQPAAPPAAGTTTPPVK